MGTKAAKADEEGLVVGQYLCSCVRGMNCVSFLT